MDVLDQAIKFLEVTSTLIKNFTSRQCYTSMADHRLVENDKCLEWFQQWQSEVKGRKDLKASERNRLFLSDKTMHDVTSCILGFKELCRLSFQAHPGCSVSACRVNSDLVENVFCQQRGRNGQNDNPTYAQYGPTINSILLGQTTTTKKGNTGKVDQYAFNKPQRLPVQRKDAKRKLTFEIEDDEPAFSVPEKADTCGSNCAPCVKEFLFHAEVSQSTLGGRNGSYACTLIAISVCKYFIKHKLPVICGEILSPEWSSMMVDCITAGNMLYDSLYQGRNAFLDVEDAYNIFAQELELVSYDENVCNCSNHDMSPVVGLLSQCESDVGKVSFVVITQERTVAVLRFGTGELVLVDSHKHGESGAVICTAGQHASALVPECIPKVLW